jgi:hypothetical protein
VIASAPRLPADVFADYLALVSRRIPRIPPAISGGAGTTYFVSNSGNDGNPGTAGQPWQNPSRVSGQTFQPGDSVLFSGGQTFLGGFTITIAPLGGDALGGGDPNNAVRVSTTSGQATIVAGHTESGLYMANMHGLDLSNLIFQGDGTYTGGFTSGVYIRSGLNGDATIRRHIHIDNCVGTGFPNCGIYVNGFNISPAGFDDVQITHCLAHDNRGDGISVGSSYAEGLGAAQAYSMTNIYVGHCEAYNNIGTNQSEAVATGNGFVGNGVAFAGVSGGLIEYCYTHHNGWHSDRPVGGACGIILGACENVTVQFNELADTGGLLYDGEGIDIEACVNCLLQYNYTHDNHAAGIMQYNRDRPNPHHGNVIRFNICENDVRGQTIDSIGVLAFIGNVTGTDVYGNTLYCTNFGGQLIQGLRLDSSGGDRFFNNLVIVASAGGYDIFKTGGAGSTFNGNAYWHVNDGGTTFRVSTGGTVYTTLAAFKAATGQEATSLNVDPLLVNAGGGGTVGNPDSMAAILTAYRLASGSPMAAGAGLNLVSLFGIAPGGRDFYNVAIGDGSQPVGAAAGSGGGGGETPVIVGFLDNVTPAGVVTGWAGDTANPAVRQSVMITVDGISVGTSVANQSRPDVHDAWPALDGNQGFTFQIPAGAYFNGVNHSIGALVNGAHLPGSPHSFLLGPSQLGATVADTAVITEQLRRIVNTTRAEALQLSEGLGRSLIGATSGQVGRAKGFRATSKKVIP